MFNKKDISQMFQKHKVWGALILIVSYPAWTIAEKTYNTLTDNYANAAVPKIDTYLSLIFRWFSETYNLTGYQLTAIAVMPVALLIAALWLRTLQTARKKTFKEEFTSIILDNVLFEWEWGYDNSVLELTPYCSDPECYGQLSPGTSRGEYPEKFCLTCLRCNKTYLHADITGNPFQTGYQYWEVYQGRATEEIKSILRIETRN